jgi:hypothetical protein
MVGKLSQSGALPRASFEYLLKLKSRALKSASGRGFDYHVAAEIE